MTEEQDDTASREPAHAAGGVLERHTPEPWSCPSCYRVTEPETVQVREKETREWVDSTVQRCPLCMYTFGGSLADRVANADAVYSYKYFGDYELSPAQMDAVGEMLAISHLALNLLEALKALDECILGKAESNASGNPEWEYVSARVNAARAAIAKAEGQP